MKQFLIFIVLIFKIVFVFSQPQYPAGIDSSGQDLCVTSPWVMILNEDFDQPVLGPMWMTHNSWCGMDGGDNDNWHMGRWGNNRNGRPDFLMLDKNVELRPGESLVALKNIKEKAQWTCSGCRNTPAASVSFTSGTLNLKYATGESGCGDGYILNNGKIEIRARLSDHRYAYGSLWLWYGSGGVNELDIIEAKGERRPNQLLPRKTNASWNVHEWNAVQYWSDYIKDSVTNADILDYVRLFKDDGTPLHVDGSLTIKKRENAHISPRQTFMISRYGRNDWFRSQAENDFVNWHKYTVEWDEQIVKFLLDDHLIAYIPQYYKKATRKAFGGLGEKTYNVAPACTNKEVLYFNNGFPWHHLSRSQLRMNNGYHNELFEGNNAAALPEGILGEMQIDYVKVYVREQHLRELNNTTAWGPLPRYPGKGQDKRVGDNRQERSSVITTALQTLPTAVQIANREGCYSLLLYDDYLYPAIAATAAERPEYTWRISRLDSCGTIIETYTASGQYVHIPLGLEISPLHVEMQACFPIEDTVLYTVFEINSTVKAPIAGIGDNDGVKYHRAYLKDEVLFKEQVAAVMEGHLFYEYEIENDILFNETGYRYVSELIKRFYIHTSEDVSDPDILAALQEEWPQ